MDFIMSSLARVVSHFPQYFGKLPGFNLWKLTRLSGVFPPFFGHFFKRAREREVKLRHVVYEVLLDSYLFFSFQIWYFRKWIITSIEQGKHMRVTRFNPVWVAACILSQVFLNLRHGLISERPAFEGQISKWSAKNCSKFKRFIKKKLKKSRFFKQVPFFFSHRFSKQCEVDFSLIIIII